MTKQPDDGGVEAAVEGAAVRLGVPVGEVWRLINTGELSVKETADGQWTVPSWSINYFLEHLARESGTPTERPKTNVVPPPTPPESKKTKKKDPTKKWKQRFDKMGKEKNDLKRRIRDLWQVKDDPHIASRSRELEGHLSEVERKLVKHVTSGVKAGFIESPKQRSGKKRVKTGPPEAPNTKFNLEQLGLQVGLSLYKETEVMNAFDPRRKLESWEKPNRARGGAYQRPDE